MIGYSRENNINKVEKEPIKDNKSKEVERFLFFIFALFVQINCNNDTQTSVLGLYSATD